jgi:hypothetical protein
MIESYDKLNLAPLAAQSREVYVANYGSDIRTSQADVRKPWWRIF